MRTGMGRVSHGSDVQKMQEQYIAAGFWYMAALYQKSTQQVMKRILKDLYLKKSFEILYAIFIFQVQNMRALFN
jgi:hypothetical protein